MSVTDGKTRYYTGQIHVDKRVVKRAYERLRKASYRNYGGWLTHRSYVRGLRDMARAVTDSNRDGI